MAEGGRGRGGRGGRYNRSRGRGKGRGSGNNTRSNNTNNNNTSSTKSKPKTLADHQYYVGSAKQATDYVTVTNFIINYIKKNYNRGEDIAKALEDLQEVDFTNDAPVARVSTKSDDAAKAAENQQFLKQYEVEYTKFFERKEQYASNKVKATALLWGQCNSTMRSKIQSRTNYETDIKDNPIKLLQAIKEHALNYESTQYQTKTIIDALKSFVNLRQKEDESSIDYLKRYKATCDVFISHAGKEFCFPNMVKQTPDGEQALQDIMSTDETVRDTAHKTLKKEAKITMDKVFAYVYLETIDRSKYGSILTGLSNQYSLGNDQYPKSLVEAQSVVDQHRFDQQHYENKKKRREQEKSKKNSDNDVPSLSFAQMKNSCYCCGKSHSLSDCPDRNSKPKDQWVINKNKDVKKYQNMVASIENVMNSGRGSGSTSTVTGPSTVTEDASVTPTTDGERWQFFNFITVNTDLQDQIILDSASSTDLFSNSKMLRDVKTTDSPTTMTTNAGPVHCNKTGVLPNYGPVTFNQDAVANILSLGNLSDKYRVTYDSAKEDAFLVHTPEKMVKFERTPSNLYAFTPTYHKDKVIMKSQQKEYNMLTTVEENKKFYTPREIKRAQLARTLLSAVGSPTIRDLKTAIATNQIKNSPVTTADIDKAEAIFGTDLGILKGKTVRRRPMPMVTDQIAIPPELYANREKVTLAIDIMFVNQMPFFTSISRNLYYRTAQFMPSRTDESLRAAIDEVFRVYNSCGFTISKLLCDNEFKPLFDPLMDTLDIEMEYSAPQAHIPEAERNNRTIKERIRATYHRLPYKALPKAVMKLLVSESARKLNFFPNKHGISQYYSPRMIMHKQSLDFERHCKYAFGQYVQAHTEHDPTNQQDPRTIDALYMRPADRGLGHEVWDLATERTITRRNITEMPVTPAIIRSVEAKAFQDGQKGLRVTTKRGQVIYDSALTAGVDYIEDEDYFEEEDDSDYEYESDEDDEYDESDDEDQSHHDPREVGEILHEEGSVQAEIAQDQHNDEESQQNEEQTQAEESDNEEQPQTQTRRSTRARHPRSVMQPTMKGQTYETTNLHQHLHVEEEAATEYTPEIAQYAANLMTMLRHRVDTNRKQHPVKKGCFLVTYSLKKGIEKFKDKGYESAKGEMAQLHERNCWKPIKVSGMTASEKRKALESLIFLVEKKSGKIKSRHCANGSKQRTWMNGDETSSPTVMTESVLLTSTIEAEENRDIATFDIPNAFIQTPVEETDAQGDRIVMKIRGPMVDMLVEIDPDSYAEYVTYENGNKVLYVHILRAIYGMLMSGLLFYKKFRKSIEKIGYEVNPYDPCVANKTIRGKQHTISWHVDDLKSSHKDPKVNDEFQAWLQKEYGQEREVTATRGKKHTYLGMLLDFSVPGEVKVDMTDYVQDMIDEFPIELTGKAQTPANEKLFQVGVAKKLDKLKSEVLHTFTAKSLFLTKRARPDILAAVAFLCTRVKEPNATDWTKLVRLMDFLKRTKKDCLILKADGSSRVIWSVDASFAVHPDLKSHTGGTMTLGRGAIQSISRKQKLNTRSSTEAELIGVDDNMAQVIWTKHFLEAQGYKACKHIIEQDNQSAIKLENNGTKSVGKRSRHINIRYFFVTDQIQKGNIEVKYCPTDDLVSDYMSKPLQGAKFHKHRKSIMNLK